MAEFVSLKPKLGRTLSDQLFQLGVEFPCGGASACGGCKVRVVSGEIPVTVDMRVALSSDELGAGWRLACQAESAGEVTLDVEQWSARILTDETRIAAEPAEGFGAAIDLGTTTLVVELVDLVTGDVRGVTTGLNPQGRYGSDVMSRIEFELREPGVLRAMIREMLGGMLVQAAGGRLLREVLLCGNTVMHHLFCGESVEPLSHVPFDSLNLGARRFSAGELGWAEIGPEAKVVFLPCAGGFVGSDVVAGLIACGMHEAEAVTALIDLGTNGEIAIGNRDRIVCASTAAGPAFEGGRIRMGMRAGDGAIAKVELLSGALRCHVIGGIAPRGICGSGLVDAAAAALDVGLVSHSGRLAHGAKTLPLAEPVELSQSDIRELQLAKGAIAAGLDLLGRRMQIEPAAIHLAGAFGNYVRVDSARRIGLLPASGVPIHPIGNSALRGARTLLLSPSRRDEILARLLERTRHVELAADPEFQERFVENMGFPR